MKVSNFSNEQPQVPLTTAQPNLSVATNLNTSACNLSLSLSASLVKEYLAAKGLSKTLDTFKAEYIQSQSTPLISSRQELAEKLGIAKLIKQNKALDQPLKTHLEIIVKSLVVSKIQPEIQSGTTLNISRPQSGRPQSSRPQSSRPQSSRPESAMTAKSVETIDTATSVSFKMPLGGFKSSNPRAASGASNKNIASQPGAYSQKKTSTALSEQPNLQNGNYLSDTTSGFVFRPKQGPSPTPRNNNDIQVTDDLEEDTHSITSDFDAPLAAPNVSPNGILRDFQGSLITTQKASMLRRLVFPGTANGGEESRARMTFTEEWKGKGFVFNTSHAELAYGLIQVKGGPCGLLAAVQAYVLKYLLFVDVARHLRGGKLRPGRQESQQALVDAISEILWQAGGARHRRAVVAMYNPTLRISASSNQQRDRYVPDGITENMELFEFFDHQPLKQFLGNIIHTFIVNDPQKHGLIQLLYSVVLSRGIETIQNEDFDEVECSLIGRHGYCTQEMVNLILLGQAFSNVHDGDFSLGEGSECKILKGIKKKSQFGYLSLFEHYGSIKVGDYMKTPSLPIFVVCSESHFTVLFALELDLFERTAAVSLRQPQFTLYYYDGLANQDNEISLDITLATGQKRLDEALAPPLELVIRTRWPNISKFQWKGSDPLL